MFGLAGTSNELPRLFCVLAESRQQALPGHANRFIPPELGWQPQGRQFIPSVSSLPPNAPQLHKPSPFFGILGIVGRFGEVWGDMGRFLIEHLQAKLRPVLKANLLK